MFGYRTKDDVTAAAGVFKSLQALYEKEPQIIDVDMLLEVRRGETPYLTVTDGINTACAAGDIPQDALKLPITEEYAYKSLSKTGGTPYKLASFTFTADDGLMIPSSQLNAMRRDALAQLDQLRGQIPDYEEGEDGRRADLKKASLSVPSEGFIPCEYPWRLRFEKLDQLRDKASSDGWLDLEEDQACILPLELIKKEPSLIAKYQDHLMAEIPPMLWPGQGAKVLEDLKALKELGLTRATADNIGAVEIARACGLKIHGGFCLNLLNSVSVNEYKEMGLADSCLSMELSYANLRKLKPSMPVGTVVYGRMPLMKVRACPARGEKGCGNCSGFNVLTDRMGEDFPMLCRNRQYCEILNCVPQFTADKGLPAQCFKLLWFTVETAAQCRKILENCKTKSSPDFRRTAGLSQREID